MRHNLLTKILVLVLALLVLIPNMELSVFAADDGPTNEGGSDTPTESFDVTGSKTASPDVLDENRETTVTLSLPSGESKYVYDVVFVMDSSSSTSNNKIDFSEFASGLFDSVKEKNINLNVGVIKCRGLAFDTISLVTDKAQSGMIEYSDSTKQTITDAINYPEKSLKALSSGTNMHGGLIMADNWLSEDESVPDDHKFIFFFIDGKMYIWNDEKNVPTSVYGQYQAKIKNPEYPTGVRSIPELGQQTIAYSKSAFRFTDGINFIKADASDLEELSFDQYFAKTKNFYHNDYAKLYASTNTELSSPTKYDYRAGYAYKEPSTASGTVNEHALTGAGASYTYALHKKYYEFIPDASFSDLNWLQANPYLVEKDENADTYHYTDTINPDFYQLHPDGLQKALYITGHYWKELVEKYNAAAIVFDGWRTGGGSGLEIAVSFDDWIVAKNNDGDTLNSDYASAFNAEDHGVIYKKDGEGNIVTDDDGNPVVDKEPTANFLAIEKIFNSIRDNIIYMVSEGVVTDVITDDFILKNPDNVNGFRMTLGGETVPATFTDGKWNFGTANDKGVYPYVVEYDQTKKTIIWTINVPIENLVPVTLSYDLILEDENADSALYPTNKSAVLDFVTTEGDEGSFTFEIPEVAYIKNIDISVMKEWKDANNQDGKRPTKLPVQLLADSKVKESTDLTAESQWTATFSGMPEAAVVREDGKEDGKILDVAKIEYTVTEGSVADYTPSDPQGTAAEGFVITNTHTPETIDIKIEKVWYDEDPSLRPTSIKVDLLADEEPVESVELSEKTGWKATFEGMPKYSNGEEIVYDVSESGIDVKTYWPLVSPSEDGFTITNTQIFDLKIKKVWDDEDDKDGVRPEEIYVTVLGNGEPFIEEIPIGEYCEWEITLYGMPVFFDGEKVEYSVIEEEVEDYEEPKIIFEPDYGFVITNTHKVEEPPKTDDATNQWFWAGMMVSSMALIAVIFYLKRKQDEE